MVDRFDNGFRQLDHTSSKPNFIPYIKNFNIVEKIISVCPDSPSNDLEISIACLQLVFTCWFGPAIGTKSTTMGKNIQIIPMNLNEHHKSAKIFHKNIQISVPLSISVSICGDLLAGL